MRNIKELKIRWEASGIYISKSRKIARSCIIKVVKVDVEAGLGSISIIMIPAICVLIIVSI
jgi:hypothetical protein